MSDIYLAKSMGMSGFQKPIVIKKLLPQYSSKPRFVQRFINEAHTLSLLNHGNIVQVLDMGMVGPEYYIALEYIEGRNVAHVISKISKLSYKPDPTFALHIIMKVAKGLAYAHKKKGVNGESLLLVHQDVNSFNIMVSYEAEVKIIDFGIARIFLNNTNREGLPVAGKLLYFSPEQLLRKPLDRRVDVYGTGVLLYELLTGSRLVQHQETVGDTVKMILEMDIAKKVSENSLIPRALKPVLVKAMALNVDDRYPWMEDLIIDLRSIVPKWGLDVDSPNHSEFVKSLFPREMSLDRKRMRKLLSDSGASFVSRSKPAAGDPISDPQANMLEELLLSGAEMSDAGFLETGPNSRVCNQIAFSAGQRIFMQGESGHEMFLIRNGKIATFVKMGGKIQTISILGPGDFFGETIMLGDTVRNVSAKALEAGDLIALDKDTFLNLTSSDLAKIIILNLVKKNRDCAFLLESIAQGDTLSRLIYGLLYFQRKSGEEKVIDLNELRDFFGLRNSAVLDRYTGKLESLGVIALNKAGIQIKDSDKLIEILNILSGRGKFSLKL